MGMSFIDFCILHKPREPNKPTHARFDPTGIQCFYKVYLDEVPVKYG
jgi:hypothetical protein